jgi:5-methylcytosine-specific restriction endonuclease McrA
MDLHPNQAYEMVLFSNLSHFIQVPEWQRLTSEKHITEIYQSILSYVKEYNIQPVLPGCLTVCKCNQTYIMVDGQHRFLAFKKLFYDHKIDIKIMCCVIEVKNEEEAHHWFRIVNSNLPLTRLPAHQRLTVPNQVAERIASMYPKVFSESDRPRRPHISKQELASQIALTISNNPLLINSTADELEQKLLEYNQWMSTQPVDTFKYPGDDMKTLTKHMNDIRTKKGGCYFGMYKQYEFVRNSLVLIQNTPTTSQSTTTTRTQYTPPITTQHLKIIKKQSIPQRLRYEVWKKFNGDVMTGKCYCCNRSIRLEEFHCGHIVPESQGGCTDVSNLKPICSSCNLSCGTKNLDEFKKLFNK